MPHLLQAWRTRQLPQGWLGLPFWITAADPQFISSYDLLEESGSLVVVWIKSLATAARWSFGTGSRSCRMNFARTCFMPRACIKISDTVVFGIPSSASSSCSVSCQSLLIIAHTRSTFSGVLFAAGLPECWITLNRFLTIFEAFVPHFYLCCTHCIVPQSLLNHLNSFHGGMFKFNAKFDAELLLYLLIVNVTATQEHAHSMASTTPTD